MKLQISNIDKRRWRNAKREIPGSDGADVLHPAVPEGRVLRHGHHGPGGAVDRRTGPCGSGDPVQSAGAVSRSGNDRGDQGRGKKTQLYPH